MSHEQLITEPCVEALSLEPAIQSQEETQSLNSRLRQYAGRTLAVLALAVAGTPAIESTAEAANYKKLTTDHEIVYNNNTSLNWSGFNAGVPNYLNYVTADFIVPSITCPATGEHQVSVWDGVGGSSSSDKLYQAGVRLKCNAGVESTYVWWEVAPDLAEQDFSGRTVSAGDKILVQTLPNYGSIYNTRMQVQDYGSDLSNPYPNWTAYEDYQTSSAVSPGSTECIVERPTVNGSYADLLNFSSVTFDTSASGSFNKACDVVANNTDHVISSSDSTRNHNFTGSALDMINSGSTTLASSSGASSTGSFNVIWSQGS